MIKYAKLVKHLSYCTRHGALRNTYIWFWSSMYSLAYRCQSRIQNFDKTCQMNFFARKVNDWNPLTIFASSSFLHGWQGSECTSCCNMYVSIETLNFKQQFSLLATYFCLETKLTGKGFCCLNDRSFFEKC